MVRRHFFLIGAGCVLALMLVAGGVRLAMSASAPDRAAGAPGGARGVVAVSQATVARRPFVDRLDVLGVVKGRQSVTVTSNTTELITGVHFKDGAFMRRGQVLVDLKAQQQSASRNFRSPKCHRWSGGIMPRPACISTRGFWSRALRRKRPLRWANRQVRSASPMRADRTEVFSWSLGSASTSLRTS